MIKNYFAILFLCTQVLCAQNAKNVLFLGNSYTYYNNLPYLIEQAATSTGDVFTHDSNTPGGYTLLGHATNTTTQNKIKAGNWDFVVLQEQSQRPSFSDAQVTTDVYPYAKRLNDSIIKYNPCAKTAFYMTWGRENGDANNCANWPAVCTYEGMDDLLRERYQIMANDNLGIAAPVGAVWRYLRVNYPNIDLYASDGSHPSLIGSYTAAITFYCALFQKDPTLVTFNSTLSTTDATTIKNAVKTIVYDDFTEWNIGNYEPVANFNSTNLNETYTFINNSANANTYIWDFGDGNTSTVENPIHTYTATGNYTVTLSITNCGKTTTKSTQINIASLSATAENKNTDFIILNNPVQDYLEIESTLFKKDTYNILIHSILGQKIMENRLTNNIKQQININALPSGTYLLQILKNEHSVYQSKFIKK